MRAASSWEACPRCLARHGITVPLTFELGWHGREAGEQPQPDRRPLPLRRIPLDGSSTEEPVEVDAA